MKPTISADRLLAVDGRVCFFLSTAAAAVFSFLFYSHTFRNRVQKVKGVAFCALRPLRLRAQPLPRLILSRLPLHALVRYASCVLFRSVWCFLYGLFSLAQQHISRARDGAAA